MGEMRDLRGKTKTEGNNNNEKLEKKLKQVILSFWECAIITAKSEKNQGTLLEKMPAKFWVNSRHQFAVVFCPQNI